jgi:CelD/BcsL family acetyltransferase involved in cellulose biosynthesis
MTLAVEMSHDIDAFAPDWPSLAHPGPSQHHVFQSVDVLKIWQTTIGAARRVLPCYLRVSSTADAPLMLLALGIERRHGVNCLVMLDGGVSDYNAPIVFDPSVVANPELQRQIQKALPRFDVALLEKLPARIGCAANPLIARSRPLTFGYEIPLAADWATYAATTLHRAKDSRRKRRRLAELGAVRFITADDAAARDRLFAALLRQKTRRYLEKNGVDGFDRPGYRAYYAEMTRQLHPRGHVHLSGLEVGGELVATHWGIVANQRFYCLMLAYENCAAARYSAARLLVENLIEWSFAQGLLAFDLGYGEAPWKLRLGAQRQALLQTEEAVTPLGWAYLNARKIHKNWRRRQQSGATAVAPGRAPIAAPAEVAF